MDVWKLENGYGNRKMEIGILANFYFLFSIPNFQFP
jgi:hypothetical protein